MTHWNEALAAYEAECDVLESIRDEFGAFLKSCFDPLGRAVASRLGAEWTGKVTNRGPRKEWSTQPRKVGLYAWYPRVCGGAAGKLVVAVHLDVRDGFSPKDGALRRALFLRAAQQELGTLPGSDPDSQTDGELSDGIVRIERVPIAAGAATALEEGAVSLADLVVSLDAAVERNGWLRGVLGELLSRPVPEEVTVHAKDVTWESTKLGRWVAGHFVAMVRAMPEHNVWVCARPPGELVVGHYGGAKLDGQLSKVLRAKRIEIPGAGEEGIHASVIMPPSQVVELALKRDAKGIHTRVTETFREYFRLAKALE